MRMPERDGGRPVDAGTIARAEGGRPPDGLPIARGGGRCEGAGAPDREREGVWRRLLTWLRAAEEAMDRSYDDVHDRRILALEREVARLRRSVEGPASPTARSLPPSAP